MKLWIDKNSSHAEELKDLMSFIRKAAAEVIL